VYRLFRGRLNLIALIIATCVVLYVVALLLQPEAITQPRGALSLLSPGSRALYQLGMTGGIAWQLGWWWTLFTAIYLHGGILHIFFNLMWIRDLGPVLTELYGPARAFVLFEVSGIAGFVVSNLVTGVPTLGASGSIFGLLAALIVYGRRRGGTVMSAQLWQWAIILFVMGLLLPGINNWAHAGGFAGGWICGHVMRPGDEQGESVYILLLALAMIAVTLVGVALSFVKVTSILLGA
jgi:rhomboid protease GluP